MNIAEGSQKKSLRERDRFYEYSSCSLEELHYQIVLSRDLRLMSEEDYKKLEDHIARTSYLLMRLRRS